MNYLENKYYNLKQLSPIVDIKYRQLLIRVKIINEKYKENNKLIYKISNKWFIHSSLIESEFLRYRKKIDYTLFATINSKNNYEKEYWRYIVVHRIYKKLKEIDVSTKLRYVIELKNNSYHLHFKTTYGNIKQLRYLLKADELTNDTNDMNTYIQYVYYIKGLYEYFRKQNKPTLLK